jgi:DedD protein
MATSPTPEQTEVRRKGRQRLIGAVAIVVLAVVFIPMVLDPEPRKERPEAQLRAEQALAIPPKEGAPPLPAPVAMPAKPAAPAVPVEAPKVETPKVEAKVEAKAEAKVEPKAPAVAAAKPAKAPELKGFAVQVGAFRDEAKLKGAREKLVAAKIPHFTERLAAGDLTRLRAGPYPTREAAEKALAGVKTAGLEGKVVPLP